MIQEQVLNYILQNKDATIITLNNLSADYFSDYSAEFAYIKNHLSTYNKLPDMETFCSHFKDFQVIEVREPLTYLMSELTQDRNKRFIQSAVNQIATAYNQKNIDGAMQLLREVSEQSFSSLGLNCVDIIHDTSRYDRYVDKVENFDKYFISTGFPELDDIIGGWDCGEDLVTVVARNGLGKSWLLDKFASEAARQGKRVGIYSGEMSEDSVGYRIDTLIGHVSNGSLVHGGGSVKNQYKQFLDSLNEVVPGSIFVLTPQMIGGAAGVATLRAFIEKYELDILFVDQHSLLKDDRGAKGQVEKAYNISTDLKLLQSTKRVPVVAVCQQNRTETESGDFDTTQIAGTDKVGQDSSVIIFIERKDDLMKLHLKKSRQSGCGQVLTYQVDLNQGWFRYIPDAKDGEAPVQDSEGAQYTEEDVNF